MTLHALLPCSFRLEKRSRLLEKEVHRLEQEQEELLVQKEEELLQDLVAKYADENPNTLRYAIFEI